MGHIKAEPQIASARFSNTGAEVIVSFSSLTDQGGFKAGVNFDCEALLDLDDADCNWVDATSLSASVSGSLGFLPGSNVTLNAGVVKSACDDGYRCECLAYANASTAVA